MSESIDILIAADDKASAKFQQVGNNAEALGKRVKETGRTVKASTELVGSFSNVLGNTQFGGAAGQLAQLTERVSAFSEVAKQGGVAALALKAGIVAAVGVATYKIAEGIASWWFELDKVKASTEETTKAVDKLSASFRGMRQAQLARDKEDFSLMLDPVERERAINARAAQIEQQAADMQARIARERQALANRQQQAQAQIRIPGIERQIDEDVASAKAQLQSSLDLQEELQNEAQALRDLVGERAKSIEARKADNAATLKSNAFVTSLEEEISLLKATTEEQRKLTAERNAPKQAGRAQELIAERDALREQLAEKKRIAELEERELDRLALKRVELEQGKEAARAFALEQQGLSREFARDIAQKEAALDAIKNSRPDKQTGTAVQGRLLTQGGTTNPVVEMLKKVLAAIEKGSKDVSKELRESAKDEPFVVKTVTVP